jgi:hypothetical protein
VGNALRHGYGTAIDYNAIPPFTTWTPAGGLNQKYKDPTSSGGTGVYPTNLIRALTGYAGFGSISLWTYIGTNSYNSLQAQLNRRTGNIQWNLNYTWSKTLTYGYNRWVDSKLNRSETNRRHAVNFNVGYSLPKPSKWIRNVVAKHALDDWKINGNGALFTGSTFGVGCGSSGAPTNYWTGTPTGGIPFRCQMGNEMFLPEGQYPQPNDDKRLQPFRLNSKNFVLPSPTSWGIGNTPSDLFIGPGVINLDLSLAKFFKITESKSLEIRVETFNTLNHMNPSNPSTGLTYQFNANMPNNTGNLTSANFGMVTGTQVGARRMILSGRIRF